MNSKIISRIELDDDRLSRDIEIILGDQDASEQAYSEYVFGTWKNCVLRNSTGDQKDSLFQILRSSAIPTSLGVKCEYLNSIIEDTFRTNRLMMARVNTMQNGLLIPHRDYVEFKQDGRNLIRLHLPLKTSFASLHSENEHVFHMKKGEVWILDVTNTHSACNTSDATRLSLVLDFCLAGDPVASLFRNSASYQPGITPTIVEREPMDADFASGIASMKYLINKVNYRDVLMFLSRVHFYKQVDIGAFFDWLIDMCRENEDKSLLENSLTLKHFMIEDRKLEQRFAIQPE